ncbi:hypothetical protein KR222_001140, partial [Zaprionus bogoriensis]
GKLPLPFQQLLREEVKQDSTFDFACFTTHGDCVALLGPKSELLTLELTSKSTYPIPFPYVKAAYKCSIKERPLDLLAEQVDLQRIYSRSNVLETQQLSLEPTYSALCSMELPEPNLLTVQWAPTLLPDGQLLLAALNSYGALHWLTKLPEHAFWQPYEFGLDIAATLRDKLQPAFEVPAAKIDTFGRYQAFVDRSWITAFAWRAPHTLLLGTAAGSLWTLNLSPDASNLLSHAQLQTPLDRICYMQSREDLLLVGDNSGLIHLYRHEPASAPGIALVKPLWLRADRMGLQQAEITYCAERACYYIACCKAAHLLVWCMPRDEADGWLEARLLAGGMKITAFCALDSNSFALGTAKGELYRVELSHGSTQLCLSKQRIDIEDAEHQQPVGLFCSPHKNLLTVLLLRNRETLLPTTQYRNPVTLCLGKLQQSDALAQLERLLTPREAINSYTDLLTEVRLQIFNRGELQPQYENYAPFDHLAFDELATESQLQRLQLKYHVMTTLIQAQAHLAAELNELELQLLCAMLGMTHARLRLQHLCALPELSEFQRRAAQALLSHSARLRQQLQQQQLVREQPINATIRRFLSQMEVHFEALQQQLGAASTAACGESAEQTRRVCSISFLELPLELENHYCTLCDRQVLLQRQQLLELYPAGSTLLCPYCHGAYMLEQSL